MGRRKKGALPPIKLVIGRSPEKKGNDKAKYTVLNQTAPTSDTEAMRSKRRASNIDPKKWKEIDTEEDEDDNDDDVQILQVYKPPAGKSPRVRSIAQTKAWSRSSSLLLDCIECELSAAQKAAHNKLNEEYKKAQKRIEQIKTLGPCTIELSEVYIGPESVTVEQLPEKQTTMRSSSPDVMILDGPAVPQTSMQNHTPTVATKSTTPSTQIPPPPPLQLAPNLANALQAHSRSQNVVLMGPNGQPIVIPSHLMPTGNQPIVLQANQSGQLQIVGSSGQTAPVIARPLNFLAPNGRMAPPLAPRMTLGGISAMQLQQNQTAIKRSADSSPAGQAPNKRNRNRKKQNTTVSTLTPTDDKDEVNWVPLDEYYYGKKEGDPAYREEKGEYRFKCFYCFKMLYNNLRIMMHIQGHIDSEKQQNLDLSDLTQCRHCYKQFDTPFEMQCHVEKIHQNRSNVLVCRICEKDHVNQHELTSHMRNHSACEMPYICQLCNFRSSVYNDVVDHFKKRHDSSRYMVCLYCLKVFEIKFAKSSGWGMTQSYYQHLLKHQGKATKLKCSRCKLVFLNRQELQMHKNKDHLPNYQGTQAGKSSSTVNSSSEQVMIRVPEASKNKVKSLNALDSQRLLLLGSCDLTNLTSRDMCIECKKPMSTDDHYKKYTECSMCRFATACNEAFAVHMNIFHMRGRKNTRKKYPKEICLPSALFCLCGFSSSYGNKIAHHLISCSKRTCYAEKPEAKWFEYDDEQEEFNPFEPYCEDEVGEDESVSPEKDIPSLFGALGLVKKPLSRSYSSHNSSKESSPLRELTPSQIAEEVINDILDSIFPAEAAASEFINTLMHNVITEIVEKDIKKFRSMASIKRDKKRLSDDKSVSTELTNEQKWHAKKKGSAKLSEKDTDYQPEGEDSTSSMNSLMDENSMGMQSESLGMSEASQDIGNGESNMDWTEDSNTCQTNDSRISFPTLNTLTKDSIDEHTHVDESSNIDSLCDGENNDDDGSDEFKTVSNDEVSQIGSQIDDSRTDGAQLLSENMCDSLANETEIKKQQNDANSEAIGDETVSTLSEINDDIGDKSIDNEIAVDISENKDGIEKNTSQKEIAGDRNASKEDFNEESDIPSGIAIIKDGQKNSESLTDKPGDMENESMEIGSTASENVNTEVEKSEVINDEETTQEHESKSTNCSKFEFTAAELYKKGNEICDQITIEQTITQEKSQAQEDHESQDNLTHAESTTEENIESMKYSEGQMRFSGGKSQSDKSDQPLVENSDQPPVDNSDQPPVENSDQPPVDNSDQPPVDNSDQPPVDNSDQPPVDNSDQPPVENSDQPPVETSDQPPVENSDQPPVDNSDQPPVENGDQPPVDSKELPAKSNLELHDDGSQDNKSVKTDDSQHTTRDKSQYRRDHRDSSDYHRSRSRDRDHERDRYGDKDRYDRSQYDRSQDRHDSGYDRNRDHYSSRDYRHRDRHDSRDRYGGHNEHGRHDNRHQGYDGRSGYQGDRGYHGRRDHRGGRAGYHGSSGYY